MDYWRRTASWLCCVLIAVASADSLAEPTLGAYRWDAPAGPGYVDSFSQWLGRPAELALAFEATERWDSIAGADWQLSPWSQWVRAQPRRNLVLSVPMLPGGWDLAGPDGKQGSADDLSLAKCAAGQYDVHWAQLANSLAYYGLHWAYLRLGWEMDGGWYAWRAPQGHGNEANFAGCFRRIVQVMRAAQPANQWKFVWNVTAAWWEKSYLDAVWPGNEYVDIVAMDLYDQSWAADTYPYPSPCDAACRLARQQKAWSHHSWYLYTLREFAAAHGKPMGIAEWGVAVRADGHGGGDNPHFIQKMHEFIQDPRNNVVFHGYFNVSAYDLDARLTDSLPGDVRSGPTHFPHAAALFKQLFGQPAPTSGDKVAPTVTLTWPQEGTVLQQAYAYVLAAFAADDVALAAVEFFVNDQPVCRIEAAPYRCFYMMPNVPVRSTTVKATAIDAAGNRTSASRTY